jgi:hypothetical protein
VKASLIILCAAALVFAVVAAAPASSARTTHQVRVTVTPVRPYQLGDEQTGSLSAPIGASPLATGCQRVPATGYLTTGSATNSVAEYANHWEWSNGSSSQSFNWWVKKTDGTTVASGSSAGPGGATNPPANNYYWRVENLGGAPQAWNVCYDVI